MNQQPSQQEGGNGETRQQWLQRMARWREEERAAIEAGTHKVTRWPRPMVSIRRSRDNSLASPLSTAPVSPTFSNQNQVEMLRELGMSEITNSSDLQPQPPEPEAATRNCKDSLEEDSLPLTKEKIEEALRILSKLATDYSLRAQLESARACLEAPNPKSRPVV